MKPFIAAAFAVTLGLLSACSSAPTSGSNNGTASSSSGVTVFGTVDAGVSGYSTRSERR